MSMQVYDVVIIGTGPAGIQAAIHASRRKARVLMVGRMKNSAIYDAHIENYAFVPGVSSGADLLRVGVEQATRFGAETAAEDVLSIAQADELLQIKLESGTTVAAYALIFSMGVSKKKLNVPGEDEFTGRGISHCADCDANFYRNAVVAITGNRSAAVNGALTLLGYAAKVYLIAEEIDVCPELLDRLEKSEVERIHSSIKQIIGDRAVNAVLLTNGQTLAVEGVFIEVGSKGVLELATELGVQLDAESLRHIAVDRQQATNIPGVYAAGDIVGPPFQVAKAVGEGCIAGMEAAAYARKLRKKG